MQLQIIDFSKKQNVYEISGCTLSELKSRIEQFMSQNDYTLKKTEGETFTFTKGSRVLRLILGALSKYHKQTISVFALGDVFRVEITKGSSGMSGGAIGMAQVRKEFEKLNENFQAYMKSNYH